MKGFLIASLAMAFFAGNSMAQSLSFSGGPQVGIAFSSFKNPAGDLYGTGILFGGHGEVSINKYISVRLSFDYATFGSDKDKLKGFVQDEAVRTIEKLIGGPLTPQDVATVRGTISSADGGRVSPPSVFVAGLGRVPTGTMFTPYGLLGMGITFLSFADLSFQSSGVIVNGNQAIPAGTNSSKIDSETKFGIQFGGGSEFKLSKLVKLMFEAKYAMIFTSDGSSSYFPIVIGATFGD